MASNSPSENKNKGTEYTDDPVFGLEPFYPSIYRYPRGEDGKTITIYYTIAPTHPDSVNIYEGTRNLHALNPDDGREARVIESFLEQIATLGERYHMRFIDVSGQDISNLAPDASIWALWGADLSQCRTRDAQRIGAHAPNPYPGPMNLVFDYSDTYNDRLLNARMAHEIGHMLGAKHPHDPRYKNYPEWKDRQLGILNPALDNPLTTAMTYEKAVHVDGYTVGIHSNIAAFRPFDFAFMDVNYALRPGQSPVSLQDVTAEELEKILNDPESNVDFTDGPGNQHIQGGQGFNMYSDRTGNDIYEVKPDAVNLFTFTSGSGNNIIRGLSTLSGKIQKISLGSSNARVLRGAEDVHFHFDDEVPILTFSGPAGTCNIRLENFSGKLEDIKIEGPDWETIVPRIEDSQGVLGDLERSLQESRDQEYKSPAGVSVPAQASGKPGRE